jgi:hypothetical protein
VAAAAMQGMSAFAYRLAYSGAVTVNPVKSASVELGPLDEVVVVATRG